MAREIINVGASPNDGTGDPLRTAYIKINNNFGELYSRYQTNPPVSLTGSAGDQAGMYASDSTYFYYCFADYDGVSTIWAQITEVGNIAGSQIVNGTSNVKVDSPNGVVTISANGVANLVVFNSGSATFNSGITASGNLVVGNISTAGRISATGNVTGNYILGNGALLTGILTTASSITSGTSNVVFASSGGNARVNIGGTSNVAVFSTTGVRVTGLVSATGNVNGSNVVAASNISAQGIISATGNIITAGYFVGNFLGNVTGNFTVPGSNTQVIFNTNGNADAVGGLTYSKDSNTLAVLGQVSAQGNVTGNYFVGNGSLLTGLAASTTKIFNGTSEANIGVANGNANISIAGTSNVAVFSNTGLRVTGISSASGNVTGGNIITAGLITATGNIQGGNIIGGKITTIGNIDGGNISTTGRFSATGNIISNGIVQGASVNSTNGVTGSTVSASGNITTSGNLVTTGTVINSGVVTGTVSASGNITTSGNLVTLGTTINTGIVTSGNVTANYFIGNGSQLTGVVASGVGTLSAVSVTGNVTGGNLITTGLISAGGNITGNIGTFNGGINVIGNINATGNLNYQNVTDLVVGDPLIYLAANSVGDTDDIGFVGNFDNGTYQHTGLARDASDGIWKLFANVIPEPTTVINFTNATYSALKIGTLDTTGIINSNANGVGNIGNSTTYFNTVFAKSTSAQYADVAEYYQSDVEYAPGTVVKFGNETEITLADIDCDPTVAGVVSENPAFVMNAGIEADCSVPVALVGRVNCKVQGPVKRGQMMVSAGNGYARAEVSPAIGTVIGKALQNFNGEVGVIEVLVGRL